MSAYSDRIIADGASHYWRLGETAGTTAADLVGGAHGTISGGVTLNQPGALSDGTRAMSFNGTTGQVVTGANVTIPLTCTIEAWVKGSTLANERPLLAIGSNQSPSVNVALTTGRLGIFDATNGAAYVVGLIDVMTGQWRHVVIVLNGSTVTFYVDGALDRTQPFVRATPAISPAGIGRDPAFGAALSGFWLGSLDEVAIYPRALTAGEISAHYALRTATSWVLGPGEKALMQARSGIARSGATRSNYYQGSAVISIDNGGGPIDITAHVVYNGWSLSLNLNDEVDTASVSLLPSCPFVPVPHSPIKIGLGAINNLEFAGIVLTVQRTRRPGPDPRFWYDLTCIDWTALLDARLVVAEYPQQSVTTTILDIVARFSRGGISTAGVAAGLPSIPGLSIVNERPSTVLRRITNKIGGGFYLDPNRVLRAWSSTIPSPMQDPAPMALTDHLATLHTFRMTEDASQQRTIVFAEGARTELAIGVPAWGNDYLASVPVEDASAFVDATPGRKLARFGTQVVTYDAVSDVVPAGVAPLATKATSTNAPGVSNIFVDPVPAGWPDYGWARIGNQAVAYAMASPTDMSIQAYTPTYGTIRDPIAPGDAVIALDCLLAVHGCDRDTASSGGDHLPGPGPFFGYVHSPLRAQLQGTPVVLARAVLDAAAAATIGPREGSDGYYDHIVQDGRWSAAGALGRAQAEILDFSQPLLSYEWETDDLNAQPGRMQHIALTEGTPVTADVRITNVTVTPLVTGRPPRRQVRATKVQTAGVVDVWVDDPR